MDVDYLKLVRTLEDIKRRREANKTKIKKYKDIYKDRLNINIKTGLITSDDTEEENEIDNYFKTIIERNKLIKKRLEEERLIKNDKVFNNNRIKRKDNNNDSKINKKSNHLYLVK